MNISQSQELAQATENMVLTCSTDGELYRLWDKTRNKQSDKFIARVRRLTEKYEPMLLTYGLDEVVQATIEYWSY